MIFYNGELKMNIQIISDLHTNTYGTYGFESVKICKRPEANVLVCAGDLTMGFNEDHWDDFICFAEEFDHVLYVMGNVDVFKTSIQKWTEDVTSLIKGTNITLLNNQNPIKIIDNIKFFGTTYWSKIPNELMQNALQMLPDFKMIQNFNNPMLHNKLHMEDYELLKTAIDADVVITHYPPKKELASKEFLNDKLIDCYYNNEPLDIHPKIWIYGHVHQNIVNSDGNTVFIENAKGQKNEIEKYEDIYVVA